MITGATKVIAIFGNPVAHSLSPQMHNAWIADHGLDAVYVALPLANGEPEEVIRALLNVGLHGANITVPFKEAAARAAHGRVPDVERLGAANTLHWDYEDHAWVWAHNTDALGARRALDEACSWATDVDTVLVVGAGGAARAIADGLSGEGRRIVVVNRSAGAAQKLAQQLGPTAQCRAWSELPAAIAAADLIVNATTLGMKGQADMDWPLERAKPGAIVFDAVYAPLETTLLRQARARGLRTVDGLGMLIHQGALAFEIWFGIKPDTNKARERLMKIIAERKG